MSDDEINAQSGNALPGDQDDDSWIEWRSMDSYADGEVALTMASPQLQVFGVRRDGVWHEMLDGEELAKPDYQPTQWTSVPQEKWDDFAFG